MTYYTTGSVEDLMSRYTREGGRVHTINIGVLGCGDLVLYDPRGKLKTYVIKEIFLNEWSYTHTIRGYNKPPEKYRKMIVF